MGQIPISVDQDYVKRSKRGDLVAFEKLVKKYRAPILRHAKKILYDEDRAEDATQDTFIKAFQHISSFDDKKPFSPWIYKIATHVAYDIIRKDKRLVPLTESIPSENESTIDRLIHSDEVKRLVNALKQIPSMYKLPLLHFYVHEASYNSIADNMNIPINTVRTRIHRAKNLLKVQLQ
jgi:RNA polymerase sigma-70 factor, ECF subfamily